MKKQRDRILASGSSRVWEYSDRSYMGAPCGTWIRITPKPGKKSRKK